MAHTPLKLHQGTAFGLVVTGQVESYCGQLTPEFYTKDMGNRNLKLGVYGSNDPKDSDFRPWEEKWIKPLVSRVNRMDMPATFDEFVHELDQMLADSDHVKFVPDRVTYGQASGFIQVNGIIIHAKPILTLGMGIPALQKLYRARRILLPDAIATLKSMVKAGITEMVTDEYYDRHRRGPGWARFMWETYPTDEFVKNF